MTEEMTLQIEQIAKVAHEVNRAYCQSHGDFSIPEWEAAPESQKNSIINGVTFNIENPGAPPSANHNNWLKQKTEEGWSYAPVKDVDAKQHPCFMPYSELPAEQRAKDYIFRQVVHSLWALVQQTV